MTDWMLLVEKPGNIYGNTHPYAEAKKIMSLPNPYIRITMLEIALENSLLLLAYLSLLQPNY